MDLNELTDVGGGGSGGVLVEQIHFVLKVVMMPKKQISINM